MVYNYCGADMASGPEHVGEHVVVVTCNGAVETVQGPMGFRDAQKAAARAMMEKFNAVVHKVEIRPLMHVEV